MSQRVVGKGITEVVGSKEKCWVVTPTYLCRKWLALRMLRVLKCRGRFLEIGIGAGDFILELARLGYEGTGIDLSDEAVRLSAVRLGPFGERIRVMRADFTDLIDQFDLIFAFEVLEHFREDIKAFAELYHLLLPAGYLMVSVPARMKHWGANDEWAGHVRRYEKAELEEKAESQGFQTVAIYSFGVPIANLTKPFYDRMIRKELQRESKLDDRRRTERSWNIPFGRAFYSMTPLIFNRFSMFPFMMMQRLFINSDLGTGYLAIFKKP